MRFKIFIAVKICFVVFWVITPNSPVCLYQSFIEIYCLYFQGRKIKIAAVSSFICWQPLARIHVVITQKTIRLSYSCHQTFTYLIAVHLRLQAECPHSFAPRFKSYLRDRLRFFTRYSSVHQEMAAYRTCYWTSDFHERQFLSNYQILKDSVPWS